MKIFKKMKKGFTLVELVVVIAVIAILAAVSVGAYFGVTESANRSKLEQEGKQVQTAIQTISLAGNEHSSLTSNGLVITNPGEFELALEESLGKEVALTDVQNTKDNTNPTIYFTDVAIQSTLGDKTYKTFEYHLPEIKGKTAQVNVVTGEVKVADSTAEGSDIPNAPIAISLEEANRIGSELETGKSTTQEYILEGQITSINNETYGNMYITAGNTDFYLYGLISYVDGQKVQYKDMTDKPEVGDIVKVKGTIKNYNGTAQMEKAELLSYEDSEIPTVEPYEISLSEANTIASEQPNKGYTVQKYIIKGTISDIEDVNYGNLTITHETDTLYIRGIYKNGVKFGNLTEKPGKGDVVTLQGILGNYDGKNQMLDAELLEFVNNEAEKITTIEGALAAESGAEVILSGEVVEIYQEYSSDHNNISVYIADETHRILVYRLTGNVALHDIITVTGFVVLYGETNQVGQGATFEKTGTGTCDFADATCTAPETCPVCGSIKEGSIALDHIDTNNDGNCDRCEFDINSETATLTFDDKAKRTEFSTSKQVWTENGITVTNNKGSGSNIGDYADPARFYKNTEVVIEFPSSNVKEIVFTVGENEGTDTGKQYFTAFGNSLPAEITVTNNSSDAYTITDYTSNKLEMTAAGQFRIYSISIIYVPGEVTPEPEQPTLVSITPNETNVSFDGLNETKTISITANYSNETTEAIAAADVEWTTSDANIATVANGVITSIANGNATITAKYNDKEATIAVSVNYQEPVTPEEPEDTRVSNIETALSLNFAGTANKKMVEQYYPKIIQIGLLQKVL